MEVSCIEQICEYRLGIIQSTPAILKAESMRVIRHESGWDIALNMVFTDKKTAETVANRIRHGMAALIRDAVDDSMCRREAGTGALGETVSRPPRTAAGQVSNARQP